MWLAAAVLLLLILALFGGLLLLSPGTPKPILDDQGRAIAGSISEKVFVHVNGTRQGMFIQGRSARNPVLLYLHGGVPDHFLTDRYPTGLEDLITVLWWEQRGRCIFCTACTTTPCPTRWPRPTSID